MLYDHEKMMLLDNFDWKNHILERLIFDKELHMKDDDSLLEENGEQQNSNIQGEEWFWLIFKHPGGGVILIDMKYHLYW